MKFRFEALPDIWRQHMETLVDNWLIASVVSFFQDVMFAFIRSCSFLTPFKSLVFVFTSAASEAILIPSSKAFMTTLSFLAGFPFFFFLSHSTASTASSEEEEEDEEEEESCPAFASSQRLATIKAFSQE